MAIFIPAGGSLMMRGGPIFWNAPIRREHTPGNVNFVGPSSFPAGTDTFYASSPDVPSASSGWLNCVSFFLNHGGRINFPVVLYFEYDTSTPAFTVNVWIEYFLNNVHRTSSQIFTASHTAPTPTPTLQSRRWHGTLPLSNIPENVNLLFRVVFSTNVAVQWPIVGLRIGQLSSAILGVLSFIAHAPTRTGAPAVGSVTLPAQPAAETFDRPAPPIRAVSPMMPIAQRARIAM